MMSISDIMIRRITLLTSDTTAREAGWDFKVQNARAGSLNGESRSCLARFQQYYKQFSVPRVVLIGPLIFKTKQSKLANDSERTRTVLYTFH